MSSEALEGRSSPQAMLHLLNRPLVQWMTLLVSVALAACIIARVFYSPPSVVLPFQPPRASLERQAASVRAADKLRELATAPPQYESLTTERAITVNAKLPFSTDPVQIARPFILSQVNMSQFRTAQTCLASAIYYEARNEPLRGREAVAQVVLNRVRHHYYPKSICGVVFQGSERSTGCQFTFTCDGAWTKPPTGPAWSSANMLAESALTGFVEPTVGQATHFHTTSVVPVWASTLRKTARIGTHIFYRLPRGVYGPRAFGTGDLEDEVGPVGILRLMLRGLQSAPEPVNSSDIEPAASLLKTQTLQQAFVPPRAPDTQQANDPVVTAEPARALDPTMPLPIAQPRRRGTLPM